MTIVAFIISLLLTAIISFFIGAICYSCLVDKREAKNKREIGFVCN